MKFVKFLRFSLIEILKFSMSSRRKAAPIKISESNDEMDMELTYPSTSSKSDDINAESFKYTEINSEEIPRRSPQNCDKNNEVCYYSPFA